MSRHWEKIATYDYALIADVDMVFVRPVGIEVRRLRSLQPVSWCRMR